LNEFGGEAERVAGKIVCIMGALAGTESVWMSSFGGMAASLCRGEMQQKGFIGGSWTTFGNGTGMTEIEKSID